MVKLFDYFTGPGGDGSCKDTSRLIEDRSEPALGRSGPRRRWTFKDKVEDGKQEVNDVVRDVITRTLSVRQCDRTRLVNEEERDNHKGEDVVKVITENNITKNEGNGLFDFYNPSKAVEEAQNAGQGVLDFEWGVDEWGVDARARLFSRGAPDKEQLIGNRTGTKNKTDQSEAKPAGTNREMIERKLSEVKRTVDWKAREFGRTVENKARQMVETDADKDLLIERNTGGAGQTRARPLKGRDAVVGALSGAKRNTADKVRSLLNSKTKVDEKRREDECQKCRDAPLPGDLRARVVGTVIVDNPALTADKKKNLEKKTPTRLWRTVRTSWKSIRRNMPLARGSAAAFS